MAGLTLAAGCRCGSGSPASAAGRGAGPAGSASAGFSYEPYARLLLEEVDAKGRVDYGHLKSNPADLDAFVASLAALPPANNYDSWDTDSKIALWINAYNALTLKAIVDHYPIRASFLRSLIFPENSIRQIAGVWDDLHFAVMDREPSLNDIEQRILRGQFHEPRIHLALNCASNGCPPLRWEPYDGERLDGQLEDQTVRFLSDPSKFRVDFSGRVYLSKIFKWYGDDFIAVYGTDERFADRPAGQRAVLNFIAQHLEGRQKEFLLDGRYDLEYLDYDWSLNEAPAPPESEGSAGRDQGGTIRQSSTRTPPVRE